MAVPSISMSRRCERPGCSVEANVLYGINNQERRVWLELGDMDEPHNAGVLCRRHADAMVVPKGWIIDDRRQPIPRLFNVPDMEPAENTASRGIKRRRVTALEVPGLFDAPIDPEDETETQPQPVPEVTVVTTDAGADADNSVELAEEIDPDETKALPWVPKFEGDDQFSGLLSSKSRLLGRAFGLRATNDDSGE